MSRQKIKVVILCGGMGTRLREETEFRPKPMVEIGGKPILWHIMKIYAHYGFCDFIICLGYKGEVIKQYFLNYEVMNDDFTITLGKEKSIEFHSSHSENGWNVTLADTGITTMTGARVKRIEKYIDSDLFMLTYGDGVADINIDQLIKFHKFHGRIATITGVYPPSRFGELITKGDLAIEFSEKPQTHQGLINGGFFVFNRKVFDYLSTDDNCSLERKPLENLARDGQLMVFAHQGYWHCMDTFRDMQALNEEWRKPNPAWKVWAD